VTRTSVTRVRPVPAPDGAGRVGFVACTVAGLRLDGLVLRRTRGGRLALSFPCRRDARGRRHPFVRPEGPGLERAILQALRAGGVEP